jgi:BA14K-like protein
MSQNQRNPFITHTAEFCEAPITHKWCVARERPPVWRVGLHIPEMEPKMINLKVLSTVAALALVLPMAAPVESYAAGRGGFGGGGGMRGGGGGGMHMGGGGFRAGAIGGGGGARFAGNQGFARPSMGAAPAARFNGVGAGPRYAGNWNGGGGNWNGGWRHRPHGGFWPGIAAGALVGGAIANSYAYYGDPYYGNGYYDDGYYDDSTVAVVPGGGGDDAGYCAQRYRSYDPASGTYLGYDGQRHPCP